MAPGCATRRWPTRKQERRLAHEGSMSEPVIAVDEWPLWEVFVRSKRGLDHKHCGSLHASRRGPWPCRWRATFTHRRQEGASVWVVRSVDQIVASDPGDKGHVLRAGRGQRSTATRPSTKLRTKWGAMHVMERLRQPELDYPCARRHLPDPRPAPGERCGHGPSSRKTSRCQRRLDLIGQARC